MKSEKKTILIWILAMLVIVLTVALAVVVLGRKDVEQTGNDAAAGQGTEMTWDTDAQESNEKPEGLSQSSNDVQKQPEGSSETKPADASKEETDSDNAKQDENGKSEEDLPKEETTAGPKEETTPQPSAENNGKLSALHLEGTQLCDEAGNPIQLRGISTHGLAWFPQYVNEECFRMFKDEWNANIVRLAMYTAENGGYCTDGDKEALKQLVKDGVAYATNVGLYVIIDWHVLNDQNPNTYKEDALVFFKEMSAEYKDYTNVIYEVCNEPNGGVSWQEVKAYAEEVIEVIRENDDDSIIIVGTPNWSQYVDQAAADPIATSDNIMYALHFYAATHKDNLRTQMKNAVNNGLPVFVSEYGICDASGNGAIDEKQANAWIEAMDDLGISYVAWNLSNKNETSAIISSNCSKSSGFTKDDLSPSGKWLYEMLTGKSAEDFTPSNTGNNSNQNSSQGNQQNQQSIPNVGSGQSAPTPTKAPAVNVSTGEGLDIQAEVKDSWGSDSDTSYNYSLTITNNSGKSVDGWEITLQFTDTITAVQGWSGNFTIDGSSLHISNADYNGAIADGESKQDIGFIITGSDTLKIKE